MLWKKVNPFKCFQWQRKQRKMRNSKDMLWLQPIDWDLFGAKPKAGLSTAYIKKKRGDLSSLFMYKGRF